MSKCTWSDSLTVHGLKVLPDTAAQLGTSVAASAVHRPLLVPVDGAGITVVSCRVVSCRVVSCRVVSSCLLNALVTAAACRYTVVTGANLVLSWPPISLSIDLVVWTNKYVRLLRWSVTACHCHCLSLSVSVSVSLSFISPDDNQCDRQFMDVTARLLVVIQFLMLHHHTVQFHIARRDWRQQVFVDGDAVRESPWWALGSLGSLLVFSCQMSQRKHVFSLPEQTRQFFHPPHQIVREMDTSQLSGSYR